MFFDNLIKEMAICIHVGDTRINRELELPSYRGRNRRLDDDVVDFGNNHQAIGFDTPAGLLSKQTLDAIDAMLELAAAEGLTGCASRQRIAGFIIQHSDLTDCHLVTLNEMVSLT